MNAVVPAAARQLSAVMRDASREQHDVAERSPFFSELLDGGLGEEAYAAYLLRLRTVYSSLERAVRGHRHDPLIATIYDPDLERLPAIDADLRCWFDGEPAAANSPAAESYRRRLESIDNGAALLAHHYTRYLGDLSGGQVIGRALDRIFNLDGAGLSLYRFPMPPGRYKNSYRDRLDALDPTAEQVDILLSEVKHAFRLNQALLDELAATYAEGCSRDR